ncbi:MAG: UPF0104 family protein [Caldilineae bacterium]|nr:MAG: UPF0104 family protein [Caldilineae bacterium]
MTGVRRLLRHRRWQWGFRLLATAVFLVLILRAIDLDEFRRVAVAPDWLPLAGMVLSAWVFVLIGGLKFWVLFRALTPVSFRAFMGYFLVATALGTFTPATLGDFSLAALLRREGIPVHQSVSAMAVDRVVTVGMYAALFLPLTLGLLLGVVWVWWIPALVAGAGGLVLVLNGRPAVRRAVSTGLARLRLGILSDFLATTSDLLRKHPLHLLGNIALTLLRCVSAGVVVQFALWAAGEYQSFLPVLYTTNSISLINLLPISLAGLGAYEGGGVVLFTRLGFDGERVFAALMYQRIYILLYSLLMLALSRLLIERMRRWAGLPAMEQQP